MRKAINGLSVIVENEMKLDVFSEYLFVFCNANKDILKILYWDRSGFALWQKRLEKERFYWPIKAEEDIILISERELSFLLEGYNVWKMRPHKKLHFKAVS